MWKSWIMNGLTHLIEECGKYALGLCSCRHKKEEIGEERCDVPLATCTTFGHGADYLIRNNLAKEISKSEMLEIFARSTGTRAGILGGQCPKKGYVYLPLLRLLLRHYGWDQ